MSSEVSLQLVLEVNKFTKFEFRTYKFLIRIFIVVVYKNIYTNKYKYKMNAKARFQRVLI